MKTPMLEKKSKDVANIYFVTFRQIILEKEKKAWSFNLLFAFCFNRFYINKQGEMLNS